MEMLGQRIKFWDSIVIRFALFFTGLMVFAILLSGYLVFRKSSAVIIESGKERIRHSAQLAEKSFAALLTEVSNDIALISSNQALQSFINNKGENRTDQVELLFENVLTNKPNYFQIRLIDSSGQEIVRYDKSVDSIFQISKSELQQKGDRDYFQEAMSINPEEYYFSRINLNEEYGVISNPPIATLRAASPLINNRQIKYGIVIINVDLNYFYNELTRISSSGIHFHLVDNDGQYLYTPDHRKEFGLQRGNGENFKKDFDLEVANLAPGEGSYDDRNGNHFLYFLSNMDFFKAQRKNYLIAALDESILLKSARRVRKESLKSLALVCLLSILISYFFIRLFSNQINQVTKAISSYENGNNSDDLPIGRKDEIGMLARSFATMREKIEQTVKELNTALIKEKQSRAQRDQLLQNMSHELRTPLHTIQGLSELLRKNKPTPSQEPIISSLTRSVQNLAGLVYDVLDHQKLVEGKLSLHLQPYNVLQLMKDIHQNYQYDAFKKGLEFEFKYDEILAGQEYMIDPLRLSQIITNLVVNAIKYTEEGSIVLEALVTYDETQSILEVRVTDSGVGIKKENLAQINEGMYRGMVISSRYGSYGLGLSIVKQLVNLLAGRFEATSTAGTGSCFKFQIPVTIVQHPISSVSHLETETSLPPLNGRKTVVQIDDDLSSLELFSYIFRSDQFDLIQFTRYDKMLEQIESIKPDIIITDLMINEKDYAMELNAAIVDEIISCPVIIVSAQDLELSKRISLHAFQKPFDPGLLLDQVYKILGKEQYQIPSFNYLYSNYDFEKVKIKRALDLLESEFLSFVDKLQSLVFSTNLTEWQSLSHKLITHIRSLELTEIHDTIANTQSLPDEATLQYLIASIHYCLCVIRLEKWVNSIN